MWCLYIYVHIYTFFFFQDIILILWRWVVFTKKSWILKPKTTSASSVLSENSCFRCFFRFYKKIFSNICVLQTNPCYCVWVICCIMAHPVYLPSQSSSELASRLKYLVFSERHSLSLDLFSQFTLRLPSGHVITCETSYNGSSELKHTSSPIDA